MELHLGASPLRHFGTSELRELRNFGTSGTQELRNFGTSALRHFGTSVDLAIAVAVTYTHDSQEDWAGSLPNLAEPLALSLAAELVPDDPPPTAGAGD